MTRHRCFQILHNLKMKQVFGNIKTLGSESCVARHSGNSSHCFFSSKRFMTNICREKGLTVRGRYLMGDCLPKVGWSADCGFCIRTWQHFHSIEYFGLPSPQRMSRLKVWYEQKAAQNTYVLYINDLNFKIMNEDFLREKHVKRVTFFGGAGVLSKINENGRHHGSIIRRDVCKFAGLLPKK